MKRSNPNCLTLSFSVTPMDGGRMWISSSTDEARGVRGIFQVMDVGAFRGDDSTEEARRLLNSECFRLGYDLLQDLAKAYDASAEMTAAQDADVSLDDVISPPEREAPKA